MARYSRSAPTARTSTVLHTFSPLAGTYHNTNSDGALPSGPLIFAGAHCMAQPETAAPTARGCCSRNLAGGFCRLLRFCRDVRFSFHQRGGARTRWAAWCCRAGRCTGRQLSGDQRVGNDLQGKPGRVGIHGVAFVRYQPATTRIQRGHWWFRATRFME